MSIVTEKTIASSDKFMFFRLTPSKFINDDLVLDSGTKFTANFDFISVPKVERNGVELTKVTTPSSNDEFSYNEATGDFVVWLASAPDEDTNVIILSFDLFYTGTKYRRAPQDPTLPESGSNPLRQWEPRIRNYPTITENFKNILAGVLTISDTNINLINVDNEFQKFFGREFSFNNRDAQIWFVINDLDSIDKIFTGKMTSPRLSKEAFTLKVYDSFNKLVDPATMGDTDEQAYARRSSTGFPTLDPNKHDDPIPITLGGQSPDEAVESSSDTSECDVPSLNNKGKLIAKNTNFQEASRVTRNRNWLLCRTATAIPTGTCGTLQAFDRSSFGGTIVNHFFMRFSSVPNVSMGDTIRVDYNDGSAKFEYYIITFVGTFTGTLGPTTYNLLARVVFGQPVPANLGQITSVTGYPKISVRINGAYVLYDQHYTISSGATAGGNLLYELTFKDDFEADFPIFSRDTLEAEDEVKFRVTTADITHADTMKLLVEASGLTTVSSTFTQADVDLTANTSFSIPYFDQTNLGPYKSYVEDLLKSTLGYLSPNIDGAISYNLFKTPVAGDVVNNRLYLKNSISSIVNYQDMATSIIASNPNNTDQTSIDNDISTSRVSSNKSKHLHKIDRVVRFRHLLDDISGRIDAIMSIRQARQVTYTYSTATEDIDSVLGEDKTLDSVQVLGATDTVNAVVKLVRKGTDKITIQLDDLGDL